MADSTFTTLGVIEQTVQGTIPAAALQLIAVKAVKLGMADRKMGRPELLTGDRRPYPEQPVQEGGRLEVPTLSGFTNSNMLREGLYGNDWEAGVTVTATTIAFTATTITDSANGLGSFDVGDMVYVSGAATAGNNGWKGPVVGVAAGALTFQAGQLSVEAAGASVTVKYSQRLLDGIVAKWYTGEWHQTQLTTKFRSAKDLRVLSGKVMWKQGDFVAEDYTLDGGHPVYAAATVGTGAEIAAPADLFTNAAQNFGGIYVGGVTGNLDIASLDLEMQVQGGKRFGLGSLGPTQIALGTIVASLKLNVATTDNGLAFAEQIALAETENVWWHTVDGESNRMCYSVPAIKLSGGDPMAEGEDVMAYDATASIHDPRKDPLGPLAAYNIPYMLGIYTVAA